MIRIAITEGTFQAIAAMLPFGSVAVEQGRTASGGYFIWLDRRTADRLIAERRQGQDVSDVILRTRCGRARGCNRRSVRGQAAMNPPRPEPRHMLDALGPPVFDHRLKPDEFSLEYAGYLSVAEIKQFDDMPWLEVRTPEDLRSFRDGAFEGPAREMPPIIVVTYPAQGALRTEIGDGRGRVNFANAYGARLHVWRLIHRTAAP